MATEYIEKQAALDIVNGWRNQLIPTYGENDEYVKCLETVAEHLESLHAADVRPVVRGRWIVHYDDLWPTESTRECSECHEEVPLLIDCKFCPNCGAEMDGGESDG